MHELANLAGTLIFLAAMVYAGAADLVHMRIPNWLVGALALLYPGLALASGMARRLTLTPADVVGVCEDPPRPVG